MSTLRFLAAESCDFAVVRALRAAGFDVLAVSEIMILIRFPGQLRQTLASVILQLVQDQGEKLSGGFVVVQPGRVRISHKPD
jgi:hypothetical protein